MKKVRRTPVIRRVKSAAAIPNQFGGEDAFLWNGPVEDMLLAVAKRPQFDLVVTSPPYNIGKEYESKQELDKYLDWQEKIVRQIAPLVLTTGSICWQVGNYVDNGHIVPLDIELHPIFKRLGFKLRNRIVWHFGHGLHSKRRFSGRYEVVLWYTKSDDYIFNLDDVRVDSKYPGKRHYKGPRKGEFSSHPLGKNPEDLWTFPPDEDVWSIPNVKGNHREKSRHPCQFPIGLIERLVLALTKRGGMVFDPFMGVGSSGAAALLHGRKYVGAELIAGYVALAEKRLELAAEGTLPYRPHNRPIYDHRSSPLSKRPVERGLPIGRSTLRKLDA